VFDFLGRFMPSGRSKICKGCWQQLHLPVPLRGIAAVPFRVFGIRPSRMNPNTCTVCEMMFTKVMRATKISVDVSVLFADLRGYTALSQSLPEDQIATLLDVFYDECAAAIWEYDGLLNKTIGDAIMAVFNFRSVKLRTQNARSSRRVRYIVAALPSGTCWPNP
jgi:adenylate cyclase